MSHQFNSGFGRTRIANVTLRFARWLVTWVVVLGLVLPHLAQARTAAAAPAEQGGCPIGTVATRDRNGRLQCVRSRAPAVGATGVMPGSATRQIAVRPGTYQVGTYTNTKTNNLEQVSFQTWMAIPMKAAVVVAAADGPLPAGEVVGVVVLAGATVGYIVVVHSPAIAESVGSIAAKCKRLLEEHFPHLREGDYRARQRVENAGRVAGQGNGNGQIPPPSGCWHRPAGTYNGVARDAATIVEYTVPVFKSGGNKYTTVSILYNVTNKKASTLTHGSTIQTQAGWQQLDLSDPRCAVAHNVAKLIVNALFRNGVP